jgi:hypothetical protein
MITKIRLLEDVRVLFDASYLAAIVPFDGIEGRGRGVD